MTIGERIQMYRKNQGLSQEDLAQKLFVSRQTVSQWETDQTVPSVDNIYRLKEVLNVSFDELLSDEKVEKEETEEKPLEEYECLCEKEEIKVASDFASNFSVKKTILLFILLTGLLLYSIFVSDESFSMGLVLGVLVMFALQIFLILKNRKKSTERYVKDIDKKKKQFRLFSDRLECVFLKDGEVSDKYIIKRDEIETFYENENYCAFVRKNLIFIISKSVVPKDSLLYKFIYKSKNSEKTTGKIEKTFLSTTLIVASVITPWLAMWVQQNFYDYFDYVNSKSMVSFFIFTPIPILSIVYGIYQRKKGYKNKANIIIGSVFLAFLCAFGSFAFMFSNHHYSDYGEVAKWEEIVDIDLPSYAENLIQYEDKIPQGEKVHYYERSDARFTPEDADEFITQISKDKRWVKDFPDNMSGCLPDGFFVPTFDYYLLYNQTTGEVNTVPKESGKYRFVYFQYLEEDRVLEIEDYTIEIDIA